MDTTAVETLIGTTATNLGGSILAVLTTVLGIGVAYFVFKFAWRKLKGSVR